MPMNTLDDEDLAAIMRALGHPVRLAILRILARTNSQCCCMDLTEALPLAQSTVSQHIKVLLDAGLVERHPRGTRNCYSVRSDRLSATGLAFDGLVSGLGHEQQRVSEPV